jgi:hypothetical protein
MSTGIRETAVPERLSNSTGSDSALGFLLKKFEYCLLGHPRCNPPRHFSQSVYPSRLLDVGTTQQSLIVLRSTNLFRNEEYVCLSHCWGSVRPFTLNAQTHTALFTGLDMRALPKTFRDAIVVTRRLRIQYIWIDSLYAIQTPRRDALALTSQMHSSRRRTGLGIRIASHGRYIRKRRVHYRSYCRKE